MSVAARYHAPFAEGGSSPVDERLIQRLLSAALDRGGDYADLFFEYVVSGSYALEEGILKSASRAVSLQVGVRAQCSPTRPSSESASCQTRPSGFVQTGL